MPRLSELHIFRYNNVSGHEHVSQSMALGQETAGFVERSRKLIHEAEEKEVLSVAKGRARRRGDSRLEHTWDKR